MGKFNFESYLKAMIPQILELTSIHLEEAIWITKIVVKIPVTEEITDESEEIHLDENSKLLRTKDYILLEVDTI